MVKVTVKLLGVLFLVIAIIAVAAEVVDFFRTTRWSPISAGQLWLNLDSSSFFATQGFFNRYIAPGLWDSVIMWILRQSAWLVAIIPGAICLVTSSDWRPEMRRKRESRPHKRDKRGLQGIS